MACLDKKVAIMTGAARGIAKLIAVELAGDGADLVDDIVDDGVTVSQPLIADGKES